MDFGEITNYWKIVGMHPNSIQDHVSELQKIMIDIDAYDEYYNNYSYMSHIQDHIIVKYKNSDYFDKNNNTTTDKINQIDFIKFCKEIGVLEDAALVWQKKFVDNQMNIYPQIYIFALLHGVSTNCEIHGWSCNTTDCSSFKFDMYLVYRHENNNKAPVNRLDDDEFIMYGKQCFNACELHDHNTDYDGLITILQNKNITLENCIIQTKRHCLINPVLCNVYELLVRGQCGGLVGKHFGNLEVDNRTKALELVKYYKKREPLIFDQSQAKTCDNCVCYPISAISLKI